MIHDVAKDSKFKRRERRDSDSVVASKDTPDENITTQQVFYYQKQKGVNLGIFVSAPLVYHSFNQRRFLDVARGINAE